MIDPADARQLDALLRRHRITLQHRLGQNFLIDPDIRDRVADAAAATREDVVVEVGAGVGTLTVALASRAKRVVAVELDRALLPALREVVRDVSNIEVVEGDILKVDVTAEVIAGNIPYNLTGALIRRFLDRQPRPRRMSLVVQKEVAERWTDPTAASLATVAVQVYTEPRLLLTIAAKAFTPQPKVDSALVVLDVRPEPAVHVEDMDAFLRFVEAVFQFRRKQLGGALARMGSSKMALSAAGIDPIRRPQTLTLLEWENLFRAVNEESDR